MLWRCEIGPCFSFWYSDSQSTVQDKWMLLDLQSSSGPHNNSGLSSLLAFVSTSRTAVVTTSKCWCWSNVLFIYLSIAFHPRKWWNFARSLKFQACIPFISGLWASTELTRRQRGLQSRSTVRPVGNGGRKKITFQSMILTCATLLSLCNHKKYILEKQ